MSYGTFAIDPVEPRVSPISAAAFTVGAGVHADVRTGLHSQGRGGPPRARRPAGPERADPADGAGADLPLLSPAVLRAKGVTGLLDVRRGDLLRAERVLARGAGPALHTLGQVWPTGSFAASAPGAAPRPEAMPDARAALAQAVLQTRRLAADLEGLSRDLETGLAGSVAEVNERAGQVAELNARIAAAAEAGGFAPLLVRRREELVLTLARLAGATAQPGAGESVTVLLDGMRLVTGAEPTALDVVARGGRTGVSFPGGRLMVLSAGVLAARLRTLNDVLPPLRDAVGRVLAGLGGQAVDPCGPPVAGGPQATLELSRMLRELAQSVESSSAYARLAAEVEVTIGPLGGEQDQALSGAGTPAAPGSSAPVDAGGAADPPSAAMLRRAIEADLAALAQVADDVAGGAVARASVVSGAPGMATPIVAAGAPAGLAVLRVVSLATGAIVGTAQTFRPDTPLGDGRESVLGIVTAARTPLERTVPVDVGRYPTPADLAALINQSNAGVHATLAELTGGTVQLRLESLATGRGQNITIVDGSQPPTASTVLGRLVTVSGPRDTVVEVQRAGRSPVLAHGTGRVLRDVLPGVDAHLHMADPSRVFEMGVRIDACDAVARVARAGAAVATAVATARAAGADGLADRLLDAIGLVTGPERMPESGQTPLQRPVPGLSLDRRGRPTLSEDRLTAAYQAEPEETAEVVAALGRRLGAVALHADASAWIAVPRGDPGLSPLDASPARPARQGTPRDLTAHSSGQERALLGMLARLQQQAAWLGAQATADPECAARDQRGGSTSS